MSHDEQLGLFCDAVYTGDLETVKSFLPTSTESGEPTALSVNLNQLDEFGYSPLHYACRVGHMKIIRELINLPEIDINILDSGKRTPLHFASFRGRTDVVKELLEFAPYGGANPSIISYFGRTPLDEATDRNHSDVIDLLKIIFHHFILSY